MGIFFSKKENKPAENSQPQEKAAESEPKAEQKDEEQAPVAVIVESKTEEEAVVAESKTEEAVVAEAAAKAAEEEAKKAEEEAAAVEAAAKAAEEEAAAVEAAAKAAEEEAVVAEAAAKVAEEEAKKAEEEAKKAEEEAAAVEAAAKAAEEEAVVAEAAAKAAEEEAKKAEEEAAAVEAAAKAAEEEAKKAEEEAAAVEAAAKAAEEEAAAVEAAAKAAEEEAKKAEEERLAAAEVQLENIEAIAAEITTSVEVVEVAPDVVTVEEVKAEEPVAAVQEVNVEEVEVSPVVVAAVVAPEDKVAKKTKAAVTEQKVPEAEPTKVFKPVQFNDEDAVLTLSAIKLAPPQQTVIADAIKLASLFAEVSLQYKEVSVTEVAKLSPFNVMPVLQNSNGQSFAGLSSLKYVAMEEQDVEPCPITEGQIDQYLQIVPTIIDLTVAFKALEASKSTDNDKINALNKVIAFVKPLNETLIATTFLLGNNITIADIALAVALKDIFALYMGPKKRAEVPALTRWFNTMVGQKAFVKTFGNEIVIQAKDVYLMPDLTQLASKPEAKKEDPISKMARSTMSFDDVKKLYMLQRPFNPDFGKDFWPMFDAAGYECFAVDFKYPEDYAADGRIFMVENGINGFVNRGDSAKRNVFVVLNIFEKEKFYHIRGAAIIRGNREINNGEIPFALKDVSDAEEYDFKFIDTSSDEGKADFISRFCPTDASVWGGAEIFNRIHLK